MENFDSPFYLSQMNSTEGFPQSQVKLFNDPVESEPDLLSQCPRSDTIDSNQLTQTIYENPSNFTKIFSQRSAVPKNPGKRTSLKHSTAYLPPKKTLRTNYSGFNRGFTTPYTRNINNDVSLPHNDDPNTDVMTSHTRDSNDDVAAELLGNQVNRSFCEVQLNEVPTQCYYGDVYRTPASLNIEAATPCGKNYRTMNLKSVQELPEKFRSIFSFPYFNLVQSKVLNDVLYTNKSIVLRAPTGSGKTVIFELAIIRLMIRADVNNCKIVYVAPIKALCSERYNDWSQRFGSLGLVCLELTGDTESDDLYDLQRANLIFTTPEKWDSMTRKLKDNRALIESVKLFLVDEIHLLNEDARGATLEAVISRMKTIQANSLPDVETPPTTEKQSSDIVKTPTEDAMATNDDVTPAHSGDLTFRFVTVSATLPNITDIAEWLSFGKNQAVHQSFDESYRPVKLRKVVLGYPCAEGTSEFRFDLSLDYKLSNVIDTYSDQKPTLVFCSTRKGVQQTALTLVKDARLVRNVQQKQRLESLSNAVKESKLRDCIQKGVAFHHAGLEVEDRKLLERCFSVGDLPVLVSTSTLAMGVNLPAHLVVVKSTQHYVMGTFQEYTQSQILQMIGRAGRPQYDTSATAVIMTRNQTKEKYGSLLSGTQVIESSLHKNLTEHLNAEIFLNTITHVEVALRWIKSTFFNIRVRKNPAHYGIQGGLSDEEIDLLLQNLCLKILTSLASVELVNWNEQAFSVNSTECGRMMARYCIAFNTMKRFQEIQGTESLEELLNILCQSEEFSDIQLRVNEKKQLNTLNKDKNRLTIRYPMDGKIKTTPMKVNCLFQTQFGSLSVQDFALSQDINKIMRVGTRVARCLMEVQQQKQRGFRSLFGSVILSKCIRAKLWENSRYVSRQITGIGPAISTALANAGLTSFERLEGTNPREIELIVNKHPPFGDRVISETKRLPKYELSVSQLNPYSDQKAELMINISLINRDEVKVTSHGYAKGSMFMMGDMDNKIVYSVKIADSTLIRVGKWTKKLDVYRAIKGEELSINLINLDYVGLDVQTNFTPFFTNRKITVAKVESNPSPVKNSSFSEVDPARRLCSHKCADKKSCAHTCCKKGTKLKPSAVTPSPACTIPAVPRNRGMINRYINYMRDLQTPTTSTPGVHSNPSLKRFQYSKDKLQTKRKIEDLRLTDPNNTSLTNKQIRTDESGRMFLTNDYSLPVYSKDPSFDQSDRGMSFNPNQLPDLIERSHDQERQNICTNKIPLSHSSHLSADHVTQLAPPSFTPSTNSRTSVFKTGPDDENSVNTFNQQHLVYSSLNNQSTYTKRSLSKFSMDTNVIDHKNDSIVSIKPVNYHNKSFVPSHIKKEQAINDDKSNQGHVAPPTFLQCTNQCTALVNEAMIKRVDKEDLNIDKLLVDPINNSTELRKELFPSESAEIRPKKQTNYHSVTENFERPCKTSPQSASVSLKTKTQSHTYEPGAISEGLSAPAIGSKSSDKPETASAGPVYSDKDRTNFCLVGEDFLDWNEDIKENVKSPPTNKSLNVSSKNISSIFVKNCDRELEDALDLYNIFEGIL